MTTKKMEANKINIILNDVDNVALVDTGACKSCISVKMLKKFDTELRRLGPNDQKLLISADCRLIKIFGIADLAL